MVFTNSVRRPYEKHNPKHAMWLGKSVDPHENSHGLSQSLEMKDMNFLFKPGYEQITAREKLRS
jgi:hypothetical protein